MTQPIHELEARLKQAEEKRERVDLLNELAWRLHTTDPQRSRALSDAARQLALQGEDGSTPYREGFANSLLNLSIAEWEVSNYQDALSLALEAVSLFKETGNVYKQAYTLNHLAGIHFFLGNYPQALELGYVALKLSEEVDDRSLQASLLNDVGYISLHLERFPDALPQLFKSLDIHRAIGSGQGEAQALDSISKAYFLMKDYPQALAYARQSLDAARLSGYQRAEADALGNLGRIYVEYGDEVQALTTFEQSLALSRKAGYRQFEAELLLEIGRLYTRQQKTRRALERLNEALTIASSIQAKQVLFGIHEALAEAYEQTHDLTRALAHYKLFHATKEQVFNEQADRRLRSLQVIHEVETAKQEAEIYQLKNVALQQEIHEREKLIGELNAFAHTVAHDLKSPLSVAIGFAELLTEILSPQDNADALLMAANMLQTGYKMGRIIDELLILSSVRQQQITPQRLDMQAIILEVESHLSQMLGEYSAVLVKPDHWPDALGYAPWIEEVWINYVNNAIKYGGRPPRVELGADSPRAGFVRFWVRDNGSGLSAADRAKLFHEFTRLDTLRAQGHGLGLSIVKRIVEKLGGTVAVDSEGIPGQGSVFSFTLPAA